MNNKDKEAFDKWCDLNGYLHIVEDFLYEAWKAACEYKDKELLEYKEAARSEAQEVNELQAENKKLREALEFYSKCDGFCADDECICSYQIAREALKETRITTN
jgi:hypothetical protein